MQLPASENAMTEIALALAMGFFSIMVLTLISMGGGASAPGTSVQAVAVTGQASGTAGTTAPEADDLVVIVDGDRFLAPDLQEIPPSRVAAHPGRVLLAVDPALPLERVMALRGRAGNANVLITELDTAWRTRLAAPAGEAR